MLTKRPPWTPAIHSCSPDLLTDQQSPCFKLIQLSLYALDIGVPKICDFLAISPLTFREKQQDTFGV